MNSVYIWKGSTEKEGKEGMEEEEEEVEGKSNW